MSELAEYIFLSGDAHWTPPAGFKQGPLLCLCGSGSLIFNTSDGQPGRLSARTFQVLAQLPRQLQVQGGQALCWTLAAPPEPGERANRSANLPAWSCAVVERLLVEAPHKSADRMQAALNYLRYELVPEDPASRPVSPEICLRTYLSAHIDHPIGLEELARDFGQSRTTFLRHCRKLLGAPPMKWLAQLRIQRAKDLLQQPELTISQVGYQVGFDNPCSFSHFFKKHTAASPRDYRRNCEWLI